MDVEIETQQAPHIMELIASAPWREAVTYRETWPHQYVVVKRDGQQELLAAFCERITRGEGVECQFFHQRRQYLFLGDYKLLDHGGVQRHRSQIRCIRGADRPRERPEYGQNRYAAGSPAGIASCTCTWDHSVDSTRCVNSALHSVNSSCPSGPERKCP